MKTEGVKYKSIYFRFYAELNDFLPSDKKQKIFEFEFAGPLKVQEAILAMHIPLSEVDLVIINGQSKKFNYWLKDDDFISVYPVFESFDISSLNALRPHPLRETKFILDAHLGKLAKYLRMAGFNALYDPDFKDPQIIDISVDTKRIILTRDKALLRSVRIKHGYYVRNINPLKQFKEIICKFDLVSQFNPLNRCLVCNQLLKQIAKIDVETLVSPDIYNRFTHFYQCQQCHKIFWKGSHFDRMRQFIYEISKSV
ncbi:twitching motility protein PilT [Labilibacter sediminis]|nr:twitching motility protein PilT [Labilibacter sediminis]